MKTLREDYNLLQKEIRLTFDTLMTIGDYSFIETNVRDIYDEMADEILSLIDKEGINAAQQEYNILESFMQIYYNDRRGNERMAYLLGVEKEGGLYVFDNDNFDTMFINFSDLNGNYSKIEVIEEIQKQLRYS
jgi:hypothetical protein